jgi:uncharacterized hydantoinase/oxoprolinase family protein
MLGGDVELLSEEEITNYAEHVHRMMVGTIAQAVWEAYFERNARPRLLRVIAGGIGEFLVKPVLDRLSHAFNLKRLVSLNDELGAQVSACAPAYAVATLAAGNQRPVH